jgi:hypothetical protein
MGRQSRGGRRNNNVSRGRAGPAAADRVDHLTAVALLEQRHAAFEGQQQIRHTHLHHYSQTTKQVLAHTTRTKESRLKY